MFNSTLIIDYLITGENALKDMNLHTDKLAKYFLFLQAIQAAIDASFIIIINLNLKKPKNYFEIFTILREANIISNEIEEKMRTFAAIRGKMIFDVYESEINESLSLLSHFEDTYLNFLSEVKQYINNIELIKE